MPALEVTRLAPSPTGALHLGNARTFLINWAMAKQQGWRVILRIEDLDTPRVKPWAIEQAMEDLRWLGMDWDEGPYDQCSDLTRYHEALNQLGGRGDVYPCPATRKEIEAAQSAPNQGDHETRYPGIHRPEQSLPVEQVTLDDPNIAWRFRLDTEKAVVRFEDRFMGRCEVDVNANVGDFVVATKAGLPAYQLAVVVDDMAQGVTQVVRGDDLIPSTGRQLLIYRALGYAPEPEYTHLPLVLGEDGRRLAKRHGDSRLSYYREKGVRVEQVLGLMGLWCGDSCYHEQDVDTFVKNFELQSVSRSPVVFTRADEQRYLKA